jgi:holo-[acyl-carrier protein] synthase
MIKGLGVDIAKNARFSDILGKAYADRFLRRVLSDCELSHFQGLADHAAKSRYLASRWAIKEAVVKATGERGLTFSRMWV